jgi:hypothetical protein
MEEKKTMKTLNGYEIVDETARKAIENLSAEDVGALPANTEIPSIAGLATEEYVETAISNAFSTIGIAEEGAY